MAQYKNKASRDPEAQDNLKSLKITDEIESFVSGIDRQVGEEKSNRNTWERRQDAYEKKRYGIRAKKSFPWIGAANFVLPQIDSDINRLKPAYINLAFGVSPIVTFEPYGAEDVVPARLREQLFNWRMKTRIPFFQEYCIGVDYMLQRGFKIYKTGWKFELRTYCKYLNLVDLADDVLEAIYLPEVTDELLFQIIAEEMKPDLTLEENVEEIWRVVQEFRTGKSKFEFEFCEKSENRADVKALDPRDEVIFPVNTCNIQDAQFICHKYFLSVNDLKKSMKSKKFNKYDEYEIDAWRKKSLEIQSDSVKSTRDGKQSYSIREDEVLLNELWTWYDVNGDGIDERVCVTYPEGSPSQVLRFIENPYDHGQFPFVVVRRELNDAEIISSRGIPALVDDFQTGISTLFNQDIDAGTISTTPTVVARKNSVKNLRNLRYVPGQVVETENGIQDYQVTQNPNLGQAARFASMQYLKAWSNDRIGNITAAISQANNTPGNGVQGQKTAREVSAIESSSGQIQSMDLLVFQNQMAELYYQIDSLYYQFGDEEEEFLTTNNQPVRISRRQIQGRFNIVPNGRLDNANPALRAQKNLMLYQMFVNDPFIRQDTLRKFFLDDYDINMAQSLMKTPEEMQQDMIQQLQSQNDQLKTALTMQQAKDNLEVRKEALLAPITGRKYAAD